MLYIKILKLNKSVADKDTFSQNDMFIELHYGSQSRRTTIKWDQSNPEWAESFVFPIKTNQDTINLQLFDADNWTECEMIGQEEIVVNLDSITTIKTTLFVIEMGNIFHDIEDHIQTIENKNEEIKRKNFKLESERDDLDLQINELRNEITNLQNKNSIIENHSVTLKEDIEHFKQRINDIKSFIKDM